MVVSAALEKRSFFGAGGEGSSGLAGSCGGVDGAGWVSWGVRLWAGGCQSTGLPSLCVLRLSA